MVLYRDHFISDMSRYYKCAVNGCEDILSARHYFPNPKKQIDKFKLWLDLTENLSLKSIPYNRVYTSHRICQRHFSTEYITRNNHLTPSAKPTLYLQSYTEGDFWKFINFMWKIYIDICDCMWNLTVLMSLRTHSY